MDMQNLRTMQVAGSDFRWMYHFKTVMENAFQHYLYFNSVQNPELEIYVQFSQNSPFGVPDEGIACQLHGAPSVLNLYDPHTAELILEYVLQNWCDASDTGRFDIHGCECILKELGYSGFSEQDTTITVQEYYEDIRKLCAVIDELGGSCTFDPPATEQDLQEAEQEIGCPIPELYKQWLMLTKYACMTDGGLELFMPQSCDGTDYVCIGSVIGDGDDYYFNRKTGCFFREFEGREITLFDSFIDLLDDLYFWIEQCADDEYGDEWGDVYEEMFPEEA